MNTSFMNNALLIAKKGIGFTSPNPAVGAVIVRNGKIIGEGYHRKAGEKHAELVAMQNAEFRMQNVRGATLYVTLEPCCHYGKTSPCTEAIAASGIRLVVVGMIDPMRHGKIKGVQALRAQGMATEVLNTKSVLAKEIREMNQPFIKWATTGLPYVTLKAGMSLDGKIATRTGESKWITDEAARRDARLERSLCDAVLVGAGTVFADDPELAPHGAYKKKKLLRVIIDSELALPLSKKVFRDDAVFVATTDKVSAAQRKKYEKRGVEFHSFGKNRVSIPALLAFLGKRNIQSVFVEGGSGVHGAFYDAAMKMQNDECRMQDVVDRILFYIAPKIIGGVDSLPVIGGHGVEALSSVLAFRETTIKNVDEDIQFFGIVNIY